MRGSLQYSLDTGRRLKVDIYMDDIDIGDNDDIDSGAGIPAMY